MKALTLYQPWASLVVLGAKRFETRSWRTHYRGPLVIHASNRMPPAAKQLCTAEPFFTALAEFRRPPGDEDKVGGWEWDWTFACGAALGVVKVVECLPAHHVFDRLISEVAEDEQPAEVAFGDFCPGRWAWELRVLRCFTAPVPCKGARGLWDFPDDLLPGEADD